MKTARGLFFAFFGVSLFITSCATAAPPAIQTEQAAPPSQPIVINENGGWCWFEDPRVLIDEEDGYLLAGTVKSPEGDVDLTVVDIDTWESRVVTLHEKFQSDDHNSPALLKLQNGHYLIMWSAHDRRPPIPSREEAMKVRWRLSEKPGDPYTWGPEKAWLGDTGVTYSNLFQLPGGMIIDFHRGNGFDPNYLVSIDNGQTFTYGGHLLFWTTRPDGENRGGRPYVRYAQDKNKIHLITTEDHPRNYDNSVYHAYIEDGVFHNSDGSIIGPVDTSGNATIQPNHLTNVYRGDARNVAWTVDLEIDENGNPYAAISVQKDDHDKPADKKAPDKSGWDLRYHYARWNGSQWNTYPLAYAGSRLYGEEADYSGLVALHPADPDVLFISANADPVTGDPLISKADNKRHYEIFRGETSNGGATWKWTPVTKDSTVDNIRPIVPKWNSNKTALLWLRGSYTTFRDYDMEVVLQILPGTGSTKTNLAAGR